MTAPIVLGTLQLILLVLTASGLGRRLMRWLHADVTETGEHWLLSLTLGLGALQFLPFLLFALRIGTPAALCIAWAAVFLLVLPDSLIGLSRVRARFARQQSDRTAGNNALRPWELWQQSVIVLLLAAVYVRAVCPAWEGDALSYHLTAPARFLHAGRFVYLPTLTYTNWPMGLEMLCSLLLAFSPASPAAVVSFLLGGLTVALVYEFAREQGGRFAGMLSVCLLLLINDLWREMTTAMVDVGLTAFATAALFCLHRSVGDPNRNAAWVRLAACFAGLAATMKLTGLWVIIAALAVYIWILWRRGPRAVPISALKFGLAALAIPAAWYIKTWILTGNPIYPMLYSWFGGREWTAAGWQRFQLGHLVFNAPPGAAQTPAILWHIHLVIGCTGLVLAAIFFVLATRSRYSVLLGAAAIFLGCSAMGNYINGRFLLPVLPSVCCVFALSFRNHARWLAVPCCLLTTGMAAMIGCSVLKPALPTACRVAFGLENADTFLRSVNCVAPAAEYANTHLGPGDRILIGGMLDYTALFHSEALWSAADLQDSIHYNSPARLDADLNRLNVRYLLFTPYPEDCATNVNCSRRREAEEAALNALIVRRGTLIFEARGCRLYRLNIAGLSKF